MRPRPGDAHPLGSTRHPRLPSSGGSHVLGQPSYGGASGSSWRAARASSSPRGHGLGRQPPSSVLCCDMSSASRPAVLAGVLPARGIRQAQPVDLGRLGENNGVRRPVVSHQPEAGALPAAGIGQRLLDHCREASGRCIAGAHFHAVADRHDLRRRGGQRRPRQRRSRRDRTGRRRHLSAGQFRPAAASNEDSCKQCERLPQIEQDERPLRGVHRKETPLGVAAASYRSRPTCPA